MTGHCQQYWGRNKPLLARRGCLNLLIGLVYESSGTKSRDRLNMRLNEYCRSQWQAYGNIFLRSCRMKLYVVFGKEAFTFTDFLKSTQVKQDCFLYLLICFWKRPTKGRSAKFFAVCSPPPTGFLELKSQHYVCPCCHFSPPSSYCLSIPPCHSSGQTAKNYFLLSSNMVTGPSL